MDVSGSERVLVVAPIGRDAPAAKLVLEPLGVPVEICDARSLLAAIDGGAGVAIIAEEAMTDHLLASLADWVARQPPWSDLPFLLLTAPRGSHPVAQQQVIRRLRNVVLVERPLSAMTLVSGVEAALRARRRQYEVRSHLREREATAQRLESLVAERTAQLEEANRRLLAEAVERERTAESLRQLQKMEALGQLTGGIAHDFNNLLSAVLGNLILLGKRVAGDETAAHLVSGAIAGTERGSALTQRLLAFSRRQDLRPISVDIGASVRSMLDMLSRSLGPLNRIDTEFSAGLWAAEVDANQLELALLNLMVNARDAMPEGGVISVTANNRTLAVPRDALAAGDYVCLSIIDQGMGMDAATLARATDPFFTTKGVGKGTGLGLSMVYGLAAQSKGALLLYSRPGHGTTAELWLPRAASPVLPALTAASPTPAPVSLAPLSLLAVDDDVLVLMATVSMLRDLGHEVTEARSGKEALELLNGVNSFDLLITDQAMPGMTGLQLAAEVRHRRPGMPILLATGYADLPREGSELPRLDKPFTQATLAAAVAAAARPT